MKLDKRGVTIIISAVVVVAACVFTALRDSKSEPITYTISSTTTASDEGTEASSAKESDTSSVKTTASATSKKTTVKTTTSRSTTTTTAAVYSFPADINLATKEMLCAVSGIGDVIAQSIIDFRDSRGGLVSMDELLEVSGIGNAKLSLLKQYFYVQNDAGTSVSTTTTSSTTSKTATTTTPKAITITTTTPKSRQKVNINTASAEELSQKLLISDELANEIVRVRGLIGSYTNIRELLMCEGFGDSLLVEIGEYIEV